MFQDVSREAHTAFYSGDQHNIITSDPAVLVARRAYAQRFLDNVVFPVIRAGSIGSAQEIWRLYFSFRQKNEGIGSDFPLILAWYLVFRQDFMNQCLAEHAPDKLSDDAADIAVANFLLEQIAFDKSSR
ncbi:MAG: hypothetical protein KF716_19680 [Anaerolineae bacterium]|nr:hypothetical protein [Anaerolineae bacterium]